MADAEYAKKAWVKYQDLPCLHTPQVRVIQGSVTSVNCEAKTATTIDAATKVATTHEYDYFVAATGLRRAWPVVPQSLTRKQYLVEAGDHIHAVVNAHHGVVVVGGGAVGIEMAAELKMVKPNVKVVLVHSRDKLLSAEALSDECKDKALELLRETGVDVLMNHRLAASQKVDTADGSSKYELTFTNGHKMVASEVIMALSQSRTTSTYLPSSATDEEGFVKIQPRFVDSIFLPCITPLTKRTYLISTVLSSPPELPMPDSICAPAILQNGPASRDADGPCTAATSWPKTSTNLSHKSRQAKKPSSRNSVKWPP